MNNIDIPAIIPITTPYTITIHDQIQYLNYAYMQKLLFLSVVLFIYVVFNYLFRFDNEKTKEMGKHFDGIMVVISLFVLVISIVYFTEWM